MSLTNPPDDGLCQYYITEWNSVARTDPFEPLTTPGLVACDSTQFVKSSAHGAMDYGSHSVVVMRFAPDTIDASVTQPTCGVNSVQRSVGECEYTPTAVVSMSTYATFDVEFADGEEPDGAAVCVYYVQTWSDTDTTSGTLYSTTTDAGCLATPVAHSSLAYEFGETSFEFELAKFDSGVVAGSPSCYVKGSSITAIGRPSLSCANSNLRYYWIDTDVARIMFDSIPETYGLCRVIFINDAEAIASEIDLPCDTLAEYDYIDAVELAAGKNVEFYFEYYGDGTDDGDNDEDCTSVATPLAVARTDYSCGSVTVAGDEVTHIHDFTIVPDIALIPAEVFHTFGSCVLEITCGVADPSEIDFVDCSTPLTNIDFAAIVLSLGDVRSGTTCTGEYRYILADESAYCTSTDSTGVTYTVPSCRMDDGTTPVVLSFSHLPIGDFTFDITGTRTLVNDEVCRASLVEYAGDAMIVDVEACSGSEVFAKPVGSVLLFGEAYTFTFAITDNGSDLCSSSITYTPPVCESEPDVLSTLDVKKYPFGRLEVSLDNPPVDGLCQYYVTEWNSVDRKEAVDPLTTPGLVACDSTQFVKSVTYGDVDYGSHSVMVMQFPPATLANEVASTQPICGVNPVQYTLTQCNYTPIASRSLSRASFGIGFSEGQLPANSEARCVYYVHTWGGDDITSGPIYSTTSRRGCSLTDVIAPLPYIYGGTMYRFEYARFDTGTLVNGPTCFVKSDAITFTSHAVAHGCTHTNILVERPDPNSLRITITGGSTIGLCTVELVTYAGESPSRRVVQSGPCDEDFNFVYGDSAIRYDTGESFQFKYSYFDNADISGLPTCATGPTVAIPIPEYNCNVRPIVLGDAPSHAFNFFSITSPAPQSGSCAIRVVCNGYTGHIPFKSGCRLETWVVAAEIAAAIGAVGGTCPPPLNAQFSYRYTSIDGDVCISSNSLTRGVRVMYKLQQLEPVGAERLRFSAPLPPELDWLTTPYCRVNVRACNGTVVSSSYQKFLSDGTSQSECSGIASFGWPPIPLPGVCELYTNVWPSKSLYNTAYSTSWVGGSDVFLYSTNMQPIWHTDYQQLQVSADGEYCLEVFWPVPLNTGGSPIDCYEVSQRVADGEYYVIHACDIQLVEQPLSATSCALETSIEYAFKVVVWNSYGSDELELTGIHIADYGVAESFIECDNGLSDPTTPTSLTVSYITSGVFAVSVNDVRDMSTLESCVLEITKYGSAYGLPTVSSSSTCSSFSFGPVDGEILEFGKTYKFRFRILNEHREPMCETREVVIPQVCLDDEEELTTLSARKHPFNRLETTLTNPHPTGACGYFITEWNGSSMFEYVSGLTDCDSAPVQLVGIEDTMDDASTQTFGVMMIMYNDAQADLAIHQPVCGVNPVQVSITPCLSTPVAVPSEESYATFDISFAEPQMPGTVVCQYYVQTWNGEDRTEEILDFSTSDAGCPRTPVTSAGSYSFGGATTFEFELAQFSDGNIAGSPSCWLPGSSIAATSPTLSCTDFRIGL